GRLATHHHRPAHRPPLPDRQVSRRRGLRQPDDHPAGPVPVLPVPAARHLRFDGEQQPAARGARLWAAAVGGAEPAAGGDGGGGAGGGAPPHYLGDAGLLLSPAPPPPRRSDVFSPPPGTARPWGPPL